MSGVKTILDELFHQENMLFTKYQKMHDELDNLPSNTKRKYPRLQSIDSERAKHFYALNLLVEIRKKFAERQLQK